MVKFFTHCARSLTLLVCGVLLATMGVFYWLHSAERSLAWAKPWMLRQVNESKSPYGLNFTDVTVDWKNAAELGHIRMKDVAVSRRDGAVFATLPQLEVTIDPLGFLPGHNFIGGVWLTSPRIFLTRDEQGTIQLGLEGATGTTPLRDLLQSTQAPSTADSQPLTLPFRKFFVTNAALDFSDINSGTSLVSKSFGMAMVHGKYGYNARLIFPFTYEEDAARLDAKFYPLGKGSAMQLDIGLTHAPAKLLCVFGLCPDDVEVDGPVSGAVNLTMQNDGAPAAVQVSLNTSHAVLNAPKLFDKPLRLGASALSASSTAASHTISLSNLNLKLEDTTITGTGAFHHEDEVGWTVALDARCSALDVTKVKHYWPLPLAPQSREWVTAKMKSGSAASGTVKVRLAPEDFKAPAFPDDSISADVVAKNVNFEYLPGFPTVRSLDANVHFTGRTIKIEGGGGALMSATAINSATLWMPDLLNPHNPMEAKLNLTAPASDVASFLALKHFAFDDAAALDASTIKGTATADVVLKFDSFSEKKTAPDEVNFDHVGYDITAKLQSIAQEKFAGGYGLKNLSGTLKAKNGSTSFNGNATIGDAPPIQIDVAQADGAATRLAVKSIGQPSQGPSNDFELIYQPTAAGKKISIKGRELDGTASYDTTEHTLLKDFPALQLDLALDRLWLTKDIPVNAVTGSLNCTVLRCESANISAVAGKSQVHGSITQLQGKRQFSVTADNAGDFLAAIDITDRMKGGKLELKGPYDDTKSPPILTARLNIRDFKLINSQILGRILTVTSLTGMQNLLTGSGISFDKLSADIRSQGGIIGVSKGKASGTSLGITLEGTVNTTNTKLDMKGVLVPAYALNSILNNLPLVGSLLGGEGEGLVGFNYSVDGTYDKPDVSVNPLSGLTPGFLRGVFGVFDKKDDAE